MVSGGQCVGIRPRRRFLEGARAVAGQTRLRRRGGSRRQALRDRRGHPPTPNAREGRGVSPTRPARATGTNEMYDPATNRWESRSPMPTARNHAFVGAVGGKIYVLGGRVGHTFITVSSNTDGVEEYDPP